MKKNIFQKTELGMSILIVIGIVIVINFLSYQIFFRLDLTQNKDYSISEASKRIAREIDDVVNVKVYFSSNRKLPSQLITLRQEVADILDEYHSYSFGQIRTQFIDPDTFENPERELAMMGIPAVQFNVIEKDKQQLVKGFLGIVVQYGDSKEVLQVVQDTSNLEYELTMAIKKVTTDEMPVLGIVSSHGSLSTDSDMSYVYKELQKIYSIRSIDLSTEEAKIPDNIHTLIIAGPKEQFNEEQIKKIDQFLVKGGSLLVMLDGVAVADGLIASANETDLDQMLARYGVTINKDLVLDVSSGMASFSAGFFSFSSNYPLWPKIIPENFDQENASVAKLESLLLPWSSSISVDEGKVDAESKISYLVKSTQRAWTMKDTYNLDPQQGFAPGSQSQENLAVSVFGKFKSDQGETSEGRLIVVGDSDFVRDRFIQESPSNLIFFQNIVDSLSLDEDLINIRSKGITDLPIEDLSEGNKAFIRYANIFGVTILVIGFGMLRYYLRRKSKFADEL